MTLAGCAQRALKCEAAALGMRGGGENISNHKDSMSSFFSWKFVFQSVVQSLKIYVFIALWKEIVLCDHLMFWLIKLRLRHNDNDVDGDF